MADNPPSADRVSPVVLRLDQRSGVPTYLQLVQQVEQALRLGYLKHGDQLPRVKDLVADLAINPNTVLKAYRELERRGLASGRPGVGTFVAGTLAPIAAPERSALRRSLDRWLRSAEQAGLDEAGIRALVNDALHERGTAAPPNDQRGVA